MKQAVKKAATLLLMSALAVGTLCQGTAAEAKETHKFVQDKPKPEKGGISGISASDCFLIVETPRGDREISTGMDGFSPILLNQKKSAYAWINLPDYSKAVSSSLKSSNNKVLKVVNKKQGKLKALKLGTAKLTAEVKWKYTGKPCTISYPVLKKAKSKAEKNGGTTHLVKGRKLKVKKGKTYTFKLSVTVRVICNKHTYGAWKTTKKATCSSEGEKQRKCKKCGTVETKWIDKLPHKYGEWKVTKPATQNKRGEKTRVCTVCGEEDVEDIDKLPESSQAPTVSPGVTPAVNPSQTPVVNPSPAPVVNPSPTPVGIPSQTPEVIPSQMPEVIPSQTPEVIPSATPEVSADLTISSARELNEFAQKVNNGNGYNGKLIQLTQDIQYDGVTVNNFIPIASGSKMFQGTFDGCGHTISGIDVTDTTDILEWVALFGKIGESGVVKNIIVSDSSFTDSGLSGGCIAGFNAGTINNCHNRGVSSYAGIAMKNQGTIMNCSSTGDISNRNNVGGIVTRNLKNGKILNCCNLGNIYSTGEYPEGIGGIVGVNAGTVQNSYSIGVISCAGTPNSYTHIGGISGQNDYTAIVANCYCSEESTETNFGTMDGVEKNCKAFPSGDMQTETFANLLNENRGSNVEWLDWGIQTDGSILYPMPGKDTFLCCNIYFRALY